MRKIRVPVLLAGLFVVCAGMTANAKALLVLDQLYGNMAGCDAQMNLGDVFEDPLILTPHSVATKETACIFDRLVEDKDGVKVIDATCLSMDEDTQEVVRMTLWQKPAGIYHVRFEDGSEWGPIAPCPRA